MKKEGDSRSSERPRPEARPPGEAPPARGDSEQTAAPLPARRSHLAGTGRRVGAPPRWRARLSAVVYLLAGTALCLGIFWLAMHIGADVRRLNLRRARARPAPQAPPRARPPAAPASRPAREGPLPGELFPEVPYTPPGATPTSAPSGGLAMPPSQP